MKNQLSPRGYEIPDKTPVAASVDLQRPPTIQEQIARFVRHELSRQAAAKGHETFQEADDFEVGEDFEPSSVHELSPDQEGLTREDFEEELRRDYHEYIKARHAKLRGSPGSSGSPPAAPPGA